MKEIVTCSQMKELDRKTICEKGIPSCVLMERAALKTAEEIEKLLEGQERVLVVCGSGNNGGDGIAIARLLHLKGIRAEIFLAGRPEKMTEETALQWKIAGSYRVPQVNNPKWDEYTTIVDAIFGVGLARPVEGSYARIIREMNAAKAKKVAVDIPSGIDGDNGQILGIAFRADLTVTFAYRKRGQCFYPGRLYAGKTVVADIGIYGCAQEACHTWHMEPSDRNLLPGRTPDGNKGTFGKVLLAAGSQGMCGAAYFSAAAALKAGAGMVQIQTTQENRVPLQVLLPEAMVSVLCEEREYERLYQWCDVLVIGPGLGTSKESESRAKWFLSRAYQDKKPVVLDADGLNLLALHPSWKEYLGSHVTVTPHVGEMSRLCGKKISEIKAAMAETAASYAKETGTVCVLKDACTVTADEKGELYLNLSGNAGMATAGSGDVLSGILAAVHCRYLACEERPGGAKAAALGVWLHGACGDIAAKCHGMESMTARDIICALPQV